MYLCMYDEYEFGTRISYRKTRSGEFGNLEGPTTMGGEVSYDGSVLNHYSKEGGEVGGSCGG